MELDFPWCVTVGINEGHSALKFPSWSFFFVLAVSGFVYELMLGHLNGQGVTS